MKIYAVKHQYNNGESYEDYCEYEDINLFSTYEKANHFFWDNVMSDYEGKFLFIEWELDFQYQLLIDESPSIPCTPWSSQEYEPDEFDELDNQDYFDPIQEEINSFDYQYSCALYEGYQEEIEAENEWLVHENEHNKVLTEIELDKLNDSLKELGLEEYVD